MIPFKRYLGKDFSVISLGIFAIAAIVRLLFLDQKPFHFDEGVNGWFVEQIKLHKVFDYNPENFHGPLYFYLLWIFDSIGGSEVFVHRLLPVVCSLASLFVFFKSQKFWSEGTRGIALLALSISPAFVFYSRYSIHESLLLFGFSLWIYGIMSLLKERNQRAVWVILIAWLVMATTKETFLVFFINAGIALFLVRFWQKKSIFSKTSKPIDIYTPLIVGVVILVFFYSEAFTRFSAVKEFFMAFSLWQTTGFKVTGHEKPFYYWLQLMLQYEWIFLLGFLLSLPWLLSKDKIKQFMALYALGNMLVFSIISYKTPWCILLLLYPYAYFLILPSSRKTLYYVSIALLIVSAVITIRLNFFEYANPREAYVYVQTTPAMKKITDSLRHWIQIHPQDANLAFLVQTDSQWPLPWLLKDYTNTSYTSDLPADWQKYDILIVEKNNFLQQEKQFRNEYAVVFFQIRYEQAETVLLIRKRYDDLIKAL